MNFKEFLLIQEAVDAEGKEIKWIEPPQVGNDAKAFFANNGVGYYIIFSPYDSSVFFKNRRSTGYTVAFDALRDEFGQPLRYDQALANQQFNNPIIRTPQMPTKKQQVSSRQPGRSGHTDEFGDRIGGAFARTNTGGLGVMGSVAAAMQQFFTALKPDVLSWKPIDADLGRVYKIVTNKFAKGKYTLVEPVYSAIGDTLIRNDLLNYISRNSIRTS